MCRFTYLAVAAPGSTGGGNDACKECSLYNLINNLPEAYVVIGDAAYGATENLISLYYGQNRRKALYDNFNYYMVVSAAFELKWHLE